MYADVMGVTVKDLCLAVTTLVTAIAAIWYAGRGAWKVVKAVGNAVAWCFRSRRSLVGQTVYDLFSGPGVAFDRGVLHSDGNAVILTRLEESGAFCFRRRDGTDITALVDRATRESLYGLFYRLEAEELARQHEKQQRATADALRKLSEA